MGAAPGAQVVGVDVGRAPPAPGAGRPSSWWPAVALAAAVLGGLLVWSRLDQGPAPGQRPAAEALGCDAAAWAAQAAAAGLAWDDRDGDCHERGYEAELGTAPDDPAHPTVDEVDGVLRPPAAQVTSLVGGTCGGFSMTVVAVEARGDLELVTLRLAAPGAGISVPGEADLRFVHGAGDVRPPRPDPTSTWGATFPLERGRTETRTVAADPGWRSVALPTSDPLGPQVQPCPVEAPR